MKKEHYLDLMERIVGVYSDDDIRSYIADVKRDGISEHGFPRLCADIGILIAHGHRTDLTDVFCEMADICCRELSENFVKYPWSGNNFSVREMVSAILETEKANLFPAERIALWKSGLAQIEPYNCYQSVVKAYGERENNWAAFAAASEQIRKFAGIADESDFTDMQISSQIPAFDENGMYRDPGCPMVYDITTRLQLSVCLFYGYDGKYRDVLDGYLEKGGKTALKMQSVTGEMPFGGRSAQYLHNEATLAAAFEYEAMRYRKKGDEHTAGVFRGAAEKAVSSIEKWLDTGKHIKNLYPRDSNLGCEGYGYFRKYMVTAASFLYLAYLFADDGTLPSEERRGADIIVTGDDFHKVFLFSRKYTVEYDTAADSDYDASGIGRIHREGAPSAICLSVPFAKAPKYNIGGENPSSLSFAPCLVKDGNEYRGCDEAAVFTLEKYSVKGDTVTAGFGVSVKNVKFGEVCSVNDREVTVTVTGDGKVCRLIPAFYSDGAENTVISREGNRLTVSYGDHICRYESESEIFPCPEVYRNRNGEYRLFRTEADGSLTVKVTIE